MTIKLALLLLIASMIAAAPTSAWADRHEAKRDHAAKKHAEKKPAPKPAGSVSGSEILSDNEAHVLSGNEAHILSGNSAQLFNGIKVFSDLFSGNSFLSGNAVLSGNDVSIQINIERSNLGLSGNQVDLGKADRVFGHLDADGDGQVSLEEFRNAMKTEN